MTNVIAWAIAGDLASQLIGIVASAACHASRGRPGANPGQAMDGSARRPRRSSVPSDLTLLRWAGRIVALHPRGAGVHLDLWDPGRRPGRTRCRHRRRPRRIIRLIDPRRRSVNMRLVSSSVTKGQRLEGIRHLIGTTGNETFPEDAGGLRACATSTRSACLWNSDSTHHNSPVHSGSARKGNRGSEDDQVGRLFSIMAILGRSRGWDSSWG